MTIIWALWLSLSLAIIIWHSIITKYHSLHGLNNRDLFFFTVLEARRPRSRCPSGWSLLRPLSLFSGGQPLDASSNNHSSAGALLVSLCVSTCHLFVESPIRCVRASFNLNDLYKVLTFKSRHIVRQWGLGLQHMNLCVCVLGGIQFITGYWLFIVSKSFKWK